MIRRLGAPSNLDGSKSTDAGVSERGNVPQSSQFRESQGSGNPLMPGCVPTARNALGRARKHLTAANFQNCVGRSLLSRFRGCLHWPQTCPSSRDARANEI